MGASVLEVLRKESEEKAICWAAIAVESLELSCRFLWESVHCWIGEFGAERSMRWGTCGIWEKVMMEREDEV